MKTNHLTFIFLFATASTFAQTAALSTSNVGATNGYSENTVPATAAEMAMPNVNEMVRNVVAAVEPSEKTSSIVYFNAVPTAETVDLKWSTAAEVNFNYFQVEKSQDGVHFYSVGKVQAKSTDQGSNTYELQDTNLLTGRVFYRLTGSYADNHAEDFQMVMVNIKVKKDLKSQIR